MGDCPAPATSTPPPKIVGSNRALPPAGRAMLCDHRDGHTLVDPTQQGEPMANPTIAPLAPEIIAGTPAVLRTLLAHLDADILDRPNPDGWSIKDIVAHLHDVEGIAFTERIGRILSEETPAIASIDPSGRLAAGGYATRDVGELLAELADMRARDIAWFQTLTSDDLVRSGQHDRAGAITPAEIAHQWAYHDLAHLRQIMEMLQAQLVAGMGNTRAFYPEAQALLSPET